MAGFRLLYPFNSGEQMDSFQKEIDERTNLTSSNKFELLLFRLGLDPYGERSELFGINVFKIREIVPMPEVTRAAGMKSPMMGMVNIRGQIIPVIDLPAFVGCQPATGLNILLITEYARSTQAFAVESVDEIVRLEWRQVLSAENKTGASSFVTSIARLDNDKDTSRLAQVLDVEQILHEIMPSDRHSDMDKIRRKGHGIYGIKAGAVAIAADDSKVARSLIEQGLRAMEIPFEMHITGQAAWNRVQQLAQQARQEGCPISDKISFVLTDLEMPEMDGFTLTRNIKKDDFLKHVPVIIHSSLSGSANEEHVKTVGGNAYVAKFEANELSAAILSVLDAVPA